MKSFLKINLIMIAFLGVIAQAQNLESLIDGTDAKAQVVDAQQTRMVEAITKTLGNTTANQKAFLRSLEKQEWRKALIQWGPAFNATAFENTDTGRALRGLLFFKNGMEVVGVERLFQANNASAINKEVVHSWKDSIKEDSSVWGIVEIRWTPAFAQIFGRAAEVQSKLKDINLSVDHKYIRDLSTQLKPNTKERALADWPLALSYAMNNKADEAAKIIGQLLKNPESPYSQDLLNMTAGRLLFQNGYFEAAVKYYEKVSKGSDYWLEAQEEMAWTYLRKGETQNALATSRSLMNSAFDNYLGPEPYFVETLAQLKVCDYPKVIEGLKNFPKLFKDRAIELDKLSKGQKSDFLNKTLEDLNTKGISWATLGKNTKVLPRELVRDYKVTKLIEIRNQIEKEAQISASIYADTMALTGYQSTFEITKNNLEQRANKVKTSAAERVKTLAKNEVSEIKKILDKLHIVEAEVIQQVEVSDRVSKNATGMNVEPKLGTTGSKKSDALVFTADSEIWFDEISNYKVDVKKGCQTIKR